MEQRPEDASECPIFDLIEPMRSADFRPSQKTVSIARHSSGSPTKVINNLFW